MSPMQFLHTSKRACERPAASFASMERMDALLSMQKMTTFGSAYQDFAGAPNEASRIETAPPAVGSGPTSSASVGMAFGLRSRICAAQESICAMLIFAYSLH